MDVPRRGVLHVTRLRLALASVEVPRAMALDHHQVLLLGMLVRRLALPPRLDHRNRSEPIASAVALLVVVRVQRSPVEVLALRVLLRDDGGRPSLAASLRDEDSGRESQDNPEGDTDRS